MYFLQSAGKTDHSVVKQLFYFKFLAPLLFTIILTYSLIKVLGVENPQVDFPHNGNENGLQFPISLPPLDRRTPLGRHMNILGFKRWNLDIFPLATESNRRSTVYLVSTSLPGKVEEVVFLLAGDIASYQTERLETLYTSRYVCILPFQISGS